MVTAKPDPEGVEAYLKRQPAPIQQVARAARALVRAAAPDAVETLKWGYPTYVGTGNIVALMCHAETVNLEFYGGADLPDPRKLLEGTGKRLRHVKVRHAKDLKDPAVKALLRAAVRLDSQT